MTEETRLDCNRCGGAMKIDKDRLIFVCEYCGNTEALDSVTASRLNAQDNIEASERRQQEAAMRTASRQKATKTLSKAVKIGICAAAALVLISIAFSWASDAMWDAQQAHKINQKYTWPSSGISQLIPQPQSEKGYISYSSSTDFDIEVPCNSDDFTNYVEQCKELGFTVDEKTDRTSFDAYDENGNHVKIYFWMYDKTQSMDISITAPLDMKTLVWPNKGIGAQLPVPQSTVGLVEDNSQDSFHAYVGEMGYEAYSAYVESCIDAGFDEDYYWQGDYFSGENSDGDRLRISYEGFNTVSISLYSS